MKKWNVRSEYTGKENILDLLLKTRNITVEEDIQNFLNTPSLNDLFAQLPTELHRSLKKASDIIKQAMKDNRPIVVHGDYDADGICATAILFSTLRSELGYERAFYFIPNRFDHGYGVSQKSVDEVVNMVRSSVGEPGSILFITVDSGITAVDEAQYIKSLGHELIITDHHQPPEQLPEASAVVWYDKVVGTTLSWLLSKVLGSKSVQTLALAALATVTDLQPVLGFNRAIVKKGLDVLNKNPPLGIKKLLQAAGKKEEEITTYDLGWMIGPRLNATGRLVDASQALKLMLAADDTEATQLAESLNKLNSERQDKTLEMYDLIGSMTGDTLPRIIISSHPDYHEGIIGLVAAKLVQKYYRPSIVISLADGHGKGSVRSIPGVDIISVLRNFSDLFTSLGGHPMAAGFSIKEENIPVLSEKLMEYMDNNVPDEMFIPELYVDLKLPPQLISAALLEELEQLKPYGLGNEEPVLMSERLGVTDKSIVGKDQQHVSLKFYKDGNYFKGIFFNGVDAAKDLVFGDMVDVVYTLKKNVFNGKEYIDLFIKDIRKAL